MVNTLSAMGTLAAWTATLEDAVSEAGALDNLGCKDVALGGLEPFLVEQIRDLLVRMQG